MKKHKKREKRVFFIFCKAKNLKNLNKISIFAFLTVTTQN